jgi:hypothetical protein
LAEDPENWNEHEKKVFIWFIIFYVYFLELEGKQLVILVLFRVAAPGLNSLPSSSTKNLNFYNSNT